MLSLLFGVKLQCYRRIKWPSLPSPRSSPLAREQGTASTKQSLKYFITFWNMSNQCFFHLSLLRRIFTQAFLLSLYYRLLVLNPMCTSIRKPDCKNFKNLPISNHHHHHHHHHCVDCASVACCHSSFCQDVFELFAVFILWTATILGRQVANVVESPAVRTYDSSDRLFLRFWRMFRRFLMAAPLRYAGVHTWSAVYVES